MTFSVAVELEEVDARQLAEAIDHHEPFDALTTDLSELSTGRWTVILYFNDAPTAKTRAALLNIATAALGKTVRFTFNQLPDTDWVAKSLEGLKPVRAARFVVHGRHDRGRLRPNDIGIEIEAGQAFGTGHHGTTAGCLAEIDRVARTRPIRSALDIGTGSGVLAIAIAKAARTQVLASDIDPLAATIARENVRSNGVASLVRVVTADGLAKRVFRERAPYDLIVANILAGPLVGLAPAIRRLIAPGGRVILSGLLPYQRACIVAAYRGRGLRLVRDRVTECWLTVVFERA